MFSSQAIGFVSSPYKQTSEIPKGLGAKHEADGVLTLLDHQSGGIHPRTRIRRALDLGLAVCSQRFQRVMDLPKSCCEMALSDSNAARLVTNSAGWLMTVESRSSAGPSKQSFARS